MHKIFESNPTLKKVFVTSDGEAFYQDTDARNHAKSLEDKSVEAVYNEKEFEVVDEVELTPEQIEMAEFEAAEKAKAEEANKAEQIKQSLASFDPETTDYKTAVKLFNDLGLKSESLKKDVIYPLLAEAKEAQTQA